MQGGEEQGLTKPCVPPAMPPLQSTTQVLSLPGLPCRGSLAAGQKLSPRRNGHTKPAGIPRAGASPSFDPPVAPTPPPAQHGLYLALDSAPILSGPIRVHVLSRNLRSHSCGTLCS
jgi:hypothetical protein